MNSSIVKPVGAQSLESNTTMRRCSLRTCSDRGASAVEYALLVGLIAVVIFGAVAVMGLNLGGLFNDAATSLDTL